MWQMGTHGFRLRILKGWRCFSEARITVSAVSRLSLASLYGGSNRNVEHEMNIGGGRGATGSDVPKSVRFGAVCYIELAPFNRWCG